MAITTNRRRFLLRAASTAAALPALSYGRVMGANGKLRVASVGCGGKGWSDLKIGRAHV